MRTLDLLQKVESLNPYFLGITTLGSVKSTRRFTNEEVLILIFLE